ncbi:MAG TPA: class I SAM-dependent methyltransferase [Xanthobacteraceae bacterium]|nr:class I SAM-dependent methyltransferase [Xanthobacteraceae bacterium]
MGFYDDVILPRLVHLVMRNARLLPYRERIAAAAQGRVLEIGIGSGLNLPFYSPAVSEVLGLEPSARLIAMAQRAAHESAQPVRLVEGSAEAIPLDAGSVDSVVTTWTLCSIPNAGAALAEMRRVLRPGGRLLFVEHGRAPDAGVRVWQDRLTPVWRTLAGGCHLNRPIRAMIEDAGFAIDHLQASYMPGPKAFTFMSEGAARPR